MRYLTVDGYFDGTGIRDAANGGYLEHDEVGISPDLSKRIDVWLEQYWKEFIKGFPDRDKVVELDEEGIRIARRLKKEFPEDKIGYFSDARMVALYDEKVPRYGASSGRTVLWRTDGCSIRCLPCPGR